MHCVFDGQVQQTAGSTLYKLASKGAVHLAHPAYQSAALLQQLMAQGGGALLGSRLQLETRGALSFPATSEPPGDDGKDDLQHLGTCTWCTPWL